jgi:predicted membrane protein
VTLFLKRLLGAVLSIATLVFFFGPVFGAPWRVGRYELATIIIIYASASAWVIGLRMRRKIKRDLGRKATEADLTSIDTWIEVEQAEERNKENKPLE